MLKCDLKNGEYTKIEVGGKLDEILSDTLNVIKTVHKGLRETEPRLADVFREYLTRGLFDPASGVWIVDDKYIKVSFDAEDE